MPARLRRHSRPHLGGGSLLLPAKQRKADSDLFSSPFKLPAAPPQNRAHPSPLPAQPHKKHQQAANHGSLLKFAEHREKDNSRQGFIVLHESSRTKLTFAPRKYAFFHKVKDDCPASALLPTVNPYQPAIRRTSLIPNHQQRTKNNNYPLLSPRYSTSTTSLRRAGGNSVSSGEAGVSSSSVSTVKPNRATPLA
ncbi:hypothetical protein Pla8534_48830 [Lignipirellula cremea]|uniref:Uncharacterized protein n=1 Tax=Lignipirellula cremea TaxID=2528010 RepID=A0A518DYY1_9BACT|nr:hypothetical protein Pla8534_48830 [Lignipirellula cremea]